MRLLLIRVHGLLERDTELLAQRLELLKVLCVLTLVLDLELDACDVLVRGPISQRRPKRCHEYVHNLHIAAFV